VRGVGVLVLAAAIAGAVAIQGSIDVPPRAERGDAFVPRPEVARLSALGFATALADYYWLQAVQIVGGSRRPEDHGTVLGRYVDVVTTLDPHVGHPYRFAAVWLTGSQADVRHANMLLRRSFDPHPEEWRNRFYLGFNHFYYLAEWEEASQWLEAASRLRGAPPYLGRLAARLRAQEGGLDVAEAMIRELARASEDPWRRESYEEMLAEIETERRARLLDAARAAFRARHGRDLSRVDELLAGPEPILRRIPREPHGAGWAIDPETRQIVSTHYGRRYQPLRDGPEMRRHLYGWAIEDEAEAGAGNGAREGSQEESSE
jgi:hypothetical protein